MSGLEELIVKQHGSQLDYGGAIRVAWNGTSLGAPQGGSLLEVSQLLGKDKDVATLTPSNGQVPFGCPPKVDCPPHAVSEDETTFPDSTLARPAQLALGDGALNQGVLTVARPGGPDVGVFVLEPPSKSRSIGQQLKQHGPAPKLAFHLYWVPKQRTPHRLDGKVLAIPVPIPV